MMHGLYFQQVNVSYIQENRKIANRTKLFPKTDEYATGCEVELIEAPEQLRQHIQVGRRGDYLDG